MCLWACIFLFFSKSKETIGMNESSEHKKNKKKNEKAEDLTISWSCMIKYESDWHLK